MKTIHFVFTVLVLALAFSACDKDDTSCSATYENEVKPIIEKSCAYSGCHSGADAGMFVSDISKDYTTYEGMMENLNNGSFTTRTLTNLDMPPAAFVPVGNPTELTAEEIQILTCWKDNGFPKN